MKIIIYYIHMKHIIFGVKAFIICNVVSIILIKTMGFVFDYSAQMEQEMSVVAIIVAFGVGLIEGSSRDKQ